MNATQAFARIKSLGVSSVSTSDVAAVLGLTASGASHTLDRLAREGLLARVRPGLWWLDGEVNLFRLPEYLTMPQPSYVSLHSALYRHGIVEQIPSVVYAVSLGKSQRIKTKVGLFSVHHMAPETFGGFDVGADGAKLATPEKAVFDYAYYAPTSPKFRALPEFELPKRFKKSVLRSWLMRVPSMRSRTLTAEWIEKLWKIAISFG